MKHLALTILAFLSLMAEASAAAPTASFSISVQAESTTSFVAIPVQCVDVYTLANGNPACQPLFAADDSAGINGGPIADSNSAAWIAKQVDSNGDAVGLTDLQCATATQPGGSNFGKDFCQSMNYNLNGKASIATFAGGITYDVTCNNANYSCGHSWSGETLYMHGNARASNPNTDHHFDALNQPCDPNGGKSGSATNKPGYAISSGDRCEIDTWLTRPAAPAIAPSPAANGSTITVGGNGQCDEDAPLGATNCSGSTASNMPEGLDINPADLVAAVQASTAGNAHAVLPYAIMTAVNCTENNYEFPSSYFDGYETANGCPPNGFRYWSDITDAQVNATNWPVEKKAIMRTLHHYGGFIFDTTGGYGPGFSLQMIGGGGFLVAQSSDSDAVDPIAWLMDTANGGSGPHSISNDGGGSATGLDIDLSSLSPYSVVNDFKICKFMGTVGTVPTTLSAVPRTCGNI